MNPTISILGFFDRPLLRTSPLFLLCGVVVVSSLLLGGGTHGGFLSDAILQLIALPLLLLTLWRLPDSGLTSQTQWVAGFCLAIVAVPLLQLLPLPPAIWTNLPNREVSAQAFALIGQSPPWMPLSVSPHRTWLSALSLIPPLAVFLSVLLLSYRERRWLSLLIVAVGTASVFVGLAQVAQGPESSLRFYDFTNLTEAVGFFANRNHFAALGYVLVLLTAAWASNASLSLTITGEERDTASIVNAAVLFTLLVVLLAGEAMARSRAGLGLTILALLGAFALGVSDRRVASGWTSTRLLGGAIVFAVLLAVQYALYRISERFEADPLADARLSFIPTTIDAAKAYFPLGSGLGTFVPVYGLFERPEGALVDTFANHAHNDFVELWLETGIVGLLLLGAFGLWFATQAVEIWRRSPPDASAIDISLARAATLAILLIILHSAADYPLRTAAMMSVFAVCCAFMIPPQSAKASQGTQVAAQAVDRASQAGRRPAAAAARGPQEDAAPRSPAPSAKPKPVGAHPNAPKPSKPDRAQQSNRSSTTEPPPRPTAEQTPKPRNPAQDATPSAVAEAVEKARQRSQLPAKQDSRLTPVQIGSGQAAASVKASTERWGKDIEWPKEWRRSDDPDRNT